MQAPQYPRDFIYVSTVVTPIVSSMLASRQTVNRYFDGFQELDGLKRAQKQQMTSQNTTEVRLNRALEEVEKYKSQLQKTKSSSKVIVQVH